MMESYEKMAHLIKLRLVITLLILVAKTTGSFNFTHHGHFARAAVTDTSKNSLTQADRDAFLNKHNTLRQQVNPTASNMKKMEWNCDLESMAQEWASRCVWNHGQPARPSPPFNPIGQNNWAGSGGYDVEGSVQNWYNEVTDYTYSSNACSGTCGHYTQVVWANSYALGCGIAYCPGFQGWSPGGYFIVCNYGPAGNYAGQKPYTGGSSCSSCPSEWGTCESSLCAKDGSGSGTSCSGPTITGQSQKTKASIVLGIVALLFAIIVAS